ncbi:MAG TPA: aspartyl-phosphate phosphatase Spo0E family protein [Cerasibacillus sp.]|uniref:aspartyl-phosphate phosphatase Spo0E family protein n=1 Tax=Cerasibacillus sp. TaxID=2498711 RepID=UPI002F40408B
MNPNLLEKIEQYRKKMINLTTNHPFTSNAVVQTSKKLDEYLNQLQKSNLKY